MKSFDELIKRLKSFEEKRRVAVVEADDEHTLQAVLRAESEGLVFPVLIGDEKKIRKVLSSLSRDKDEREIINSSSGEESAMTAALLAREGKADCIMKGHIETAVMMKVMVNREHGIRTGATMSLVAFMESPNYHKLFAITDVGLLTYPDREQKKAALENAVRALRRLGLERVKAGIIAAVEKENPKMPETLDAAWIKSEGCEGAVIEGPISFDLAFSRESALIKGYESDVAGDADLIVVPDIVSGNIAAKSITVLGGARTGGSVLGALVPVILTSRAASAEDKYLSIVVSALIGRDK